MNNLQYMKYSKFGFTICKNINIFLYFSDLLIIIDIQYGTCQWNKYISLIIGHSLKNIMWIMHQNFFHYLSEKMFY